MIPLMFYSDFSDCQLEEGWVGETGAQAAGRSGSTDVVWVGGAVPRPRWRRWRWREVDDLSSVLTLELITTCWCKDENSGLIGRVPGWV